MKYDDMRVMPCPRLCKAAPRSPTHPHGRVQEATGNPSCTSQT